MSRFQQGSAVGPDTIGLLGLVGESDRLAQASRMNERNLAENARQADMGVAQDQARMAQQESQFGRSMEQEGRQFRQGMDFQTQEREAQQVWQTEEGAKAQAIIQQRMDEANQMKVLMWQKEQEVALTTGLAREKAIREYQTIAASRADKMAKLAAATSLIGQDRSKLRSQMGNLKKKAQEMVLQVGQAKEMGAGWAERAAEAMETKLRSQGVIGLNGPGAWATEATDSATLTDAIGSSITGSKVGALGRAVSSITGAYDSAPSVHASTAIELAADSLASEMVHEMKAGSGSPRELKALVQAIMLGSGPTPQDGPLAASGERIISAYTAMNRLREMGYDPHAVNSAVDGFLGSEFDSLRVDKLKSAGAGVRGTASVGTLGPDQWESFNQSVVGDVLEEAAKRIHGATTNRRAAMEAFLMDPKELSTGIERLGEALDRGDDLSNIEGLVGGGRGGRSLAQLADKEGIRATVGRIASGEQAAAGLVGAAGADVPELAAREMAMQSGQVGAVEEARGGIRAANDVMQEIQRQKQARKVP